MKKLCTLLAAMMLFTLAGCKDATAGIQWKRSTDHHRRQQNNQRGYLRSDQNQRRSKRNAEPDQDTDLQEGKYQVSDA